jgi:flagellar basal-body rod protein FlgF
MRPVVRLQESVGMETASYVAMSKQQVLQQAMEVIANNLANASTGGFKSQQAVFADYLARGPNNQKIDYVRDLGSARDMRQGDLRLTGNPLDAAIEGKGFYTIQTPNGPRYTRASSFQTTPAGMLVTARGEPVLDDRGNPITLPQNNGKVVIGPAGTIAVGQVPVAKLGVVQFDNPSQLVEEEAGLYTTTQAPTPDTTSQVRQGVVEGSNVQSVVQITRMIAVQGAYSDTAQILQSEDTRLKNAVDKLARVA